MQIRWKNGDGFIADNTGVDGEYLTWDFGPLTHGQAAKVHVTVPITYSEGYAADAAMTAEDYGGTAGDLGDVASGVMTVLIVLAVFGFVFFVIASRSPAWGGGFGSGLYPDDWFWYTNGVHIIRRARTAPPPPGITAPIRPRTSSRAAGPAAAVVWAAGTAAAATTTSAAPVPALPVVPAPVPVPAAAVPDAV